ncbi:unannotated protein [freshwater metagenome]|uniref:Unannotated protein n=1 Tax=freshwater metagenome TaxID=449393 RepID=A0A6J7DQ75_9ZZZZ|nr:hypothetical protein [Actinomycetota bacterium]
MPEPDITRAEILERWSAALSANDTPSIGRLVQLGHAMQGVDPARRIGTPQAEESLDPAPS